MAADQTAKCLFRVTCEGIYERYVPILDEWEPDNEFVISLYDIDIDFQQVDEFEAGAFIESAQLQKNAINPCSLQFRQMMYLQNRDLNI